MSSYPQNVTEISPTGTGIPPAPPAGQELVTKKVLFYTGLNAQAFSGAMNPSGIYRQMVNGDPLVHQYYRELEEKDTAIASALETRKLLVLAREAAVQSAGASRTATGNAARADELQQGLAMFLDSIRCWRRVLRELLDAPAFGYSVMELLWEIGADGSIEIKDIIGRPQELFRFGKLTEPQNGPLLLANFPGGEGVPVPAAKFLVNTYTARHGDRRGLPLLRRLFWPSWFKRNALRFHLSFLEKGNGTVAVQYDSAGAGDADKNKALEAATAIATEIAVAFPRGFEVVKELLETTRTRQAADYEGMFDYFDDEMTRIILGQTQTTRVGEGGKGTQAIGQVHEGTQDDVVASDAYDLEECINEQLCAPWLVWTYGPDALDRAVRPWWTIEKEPPKDAERELRVIKSAHSLLGELSRIPASEVYRAAGVSAAEGDEEILPAAAPGIGELLGGVPPANPGAAEPGA